MITKKKLLVYKKYKGDIDSLTRFGSSKEKNLMSNDDWYLIDSLIQDIVIIKHNLQQKLKKETDSNQTSKIIISMAIKDDFIDSNSLKNPDFSIIAFFKNLFR